MARKPPLPELSNPEALKQFIEQVYKLNRERGWGCRKIAKYLNVSYVFIHRMLKHGDPEKAFEYYKELYVSKPRAKREAFEEMLAKSVEKMEELEEEEKVKEEIKMEKQYTTRLTKASVRRVLTELTKRVSQLSLEHMKRIIEQGLLVDEVFEDILKEKEEILKRIAVEERLKRELLNEGLIYLLAGKIDREKFARLLLATELM